MMESKNKPMDAYEWALKTYGDQIPDDIQKSMEEYASYRLSFVPPDIEKAIGDEYPIDESLSETDKYLQASRRHGAYFGYSLSSAQILGLNREPVRMVFDYCQNDEGYGCAGCLGDGKGDCAAVVKPLKPVEVSSGWVSVADRMPTCYLSGSWDGLKSDKVFVETKDGSYFVAVLYSGILDGSAFSDWYEQGDYEITDVVRWMNIPY